MEEQADSLYHRQREVIIYIYIYIYNIYEIEVTGKSNTAEDNSNSVLQSRNNNQEGQKYYRFRDEIEYKQQTGMGENMSEGREDGEQTDKSLNKRNWGRNNRELERYYKSLRGNESNLGALTKRELLALNDLMGPHLGGGVNDAHNPHSSVFGKEENMKMIMNLMPNHTNLHNLHNMHNNQELRIAAKTYLGPDGATPAYNPLVYYIYIYIYLYIYIYI